MSEKSEAANFAYGVSQLADAVEVRGGDPHEIQGLSVKTLKALVEYVEELWSDVDGG